MGGLRCAAVGVGIAVWISAPGAAWAVPQPPEIPNVIDETDGGAFPFGTYDENSSLITACKKDDKSEACGPVAAIDSLVYLQKRFPFFYGEPGPLLVPDTTAAGINGLAKTLATDMGCSCESGGTSPTEGLQFVSDHQATYPIATMCLVLGVSSSDYYAWRKRRPSRRTQRDATLTEEIPAAHSASRGTYGAPRVHAELAAKGIRVGRKRVARLMLRAGLAGVSRRRFAAATLKGDRRQAPDLVERNFTAQAPDRLWVADITYIPTWAGFLYLAVALDAFSRRIVGWSMATTLATQLVLDASAAVVPVREACTIDSARTRW